VRATAAFVLPPLGIGEALPSRGVGHGCSKRYRARHSSRAGAFPASLPA